MQQQHFEFIHDNIDGNKILVQMDFSDTFTITEQNAGQSSHRANVKCTLFTLRIWVNKNITQSLTFDSDYLVHGKLAVHKFLLVTLEYVKENYGHVEKIDLFSDCTSS